jgi:hypothetical protein
MNDSTLGIGKRDTAPVQAVTPKVKAWPFEKVIKRTNSSFLERSK